VLRRSHRSAAPGRRPQQTQSSRVLVVDDNAAIAIPVAAPHARWHHVHDAEDGAAALALADSGGLISSCSICDAGLTASRCVPPQGEERTRDIPVVMISALDEIDSNGALHRGGGRGLPAQAVSTRFCCRARINACLEKKRLRDGSARSPRSCGPKRSGRKRSF